MSALTALQKTLVTTLKQCLKEGMTPRELNHLCFSTIEKEVDTGKKDGILVHRSYSFGAGPAELSPEFKEF